MFYVADNNTGDFPGYVHRYPSISGARSGGRRQREPNPDPAAIESFRAKWRECETCDMALLTRSAARETELAALIKSVRADVVAIAEAEVPEGVAITIDGYRTYYGSPDAKGIIRTLMLVREALATASTELLSATSDIWVHLPSGVVFGSVYHLWRPAEGVKAAAEALLGRVRDLASKHRCIVASGDFNLDADRLEDTSYPHRRLAVSFVEEVHEVIVKEMMQEGALLPPTLHGRCLFGGVGVIG